MQPQTRYTESGDVNIAYQVVGNGPSDLVVVPGWISHLDLQWTDPTFTRFVRRLASFSRVILFDKRGVGLSDPATAASTFEERMDDIRAVMDAVGSDRGALFGLSEGGPLSLLFAATYPERTTKLVLYGTYATGLLAAHPSGERWRHSMDTLRHATYHWGEGRSLSLFAPSLAGDQAFRQAWGMFERAAMSPTMARVLIDAILACDVRCVLPIVQVPTLVLHRAGDLACPVEGGRAIAAQIAGARYVEFEGVDHSPLAGDIDALVSEIEGFLVGTRLTTSLDRVLATVLFTDIVRSTERAAELGDAQWSELLARHDRTIRQILAGFRGQEVKQTGDGFLATFDGPARAVRCAVSITEALRHQGLEIRAGLHAGECELVGNDVRGIAVHIGARVAALAAPGEVLVSQTVRDLVVGSEIRFVHRGDYELKGVPGEWRLFSVRP